MQKAISALILSTGCDPSHLLDRVFAEAGITPEIRLTSGAAQDELKNRDFDLLLLDFDEPESLSLLQAWNRRGPNCSKVAIVVSSRPELLTLAQLYEAQMVLQKPLRKSLVDKTIKMAAEIVGQKKRSSYRHSVTIKCSATACNQDRQLKLANVLLLDISRNGLCMKAPFSLELETKIDLSFLLPETSDFIHVSGRVVRSEPNGIAGVFFVPSQPDRKKLESWLDARDPTAETVTQIDSPMERAEGYRAVSRVFR
jgi:DNA-binding response OmpR family regulator